MTAGMQYWRALRAAPDEEVLRMWHRAMSVPLVADPQMAAAKGRLWRAAILTTAIHVGQPAVPADRALNEYMPWAEGCAPGTLADAALQHRIANSPEFHARGAPAIVACPILVLGSSTDRVWRWELMPHWADVAGPHGHELREFSVSHFKLMLLPEAFQAIIAHLHAALMAYAAHTDDEDDLP